jgi:hypothetical protein
MYNGMHKPIHSCILYSITFSILELYCYSIKMDYYPRKKVSKISILFNYSMLLVYRWYNLPTPGVFSERTGGRGYPKTIPSTKKALISIIAHGWRDRYIKKLI